MAYWSILISSAGGDSNCYTLNCTHFSVVSASPAGAVGRVVEEGPEVGRLARPGVFQSRADREEGGL